MNSDSDWGSGSVAKSDGAWALFSYRSYVLFLSGRFLGTLATGSQAVTIAWEVYEVARATMSVAEASFAVGMIGLAQFVPVFALTLVAGEVADRHDRRKIMMGCYFAQVLVSAGLAWQSSMGGRLYWIFALASAFGATRSFFFPAVSALGPMMVPLRLLTRAIAINSLFGQLGLILGPALGGILCAISPKVGYLVSAGLYLISTLCISSIRAETKPQVEPGRSRREQIVEGLHYVWSNKLVFGAISLDLFAVLLGGATGLLPVFARDVLGVGPEGFGVLRRRRASGRSWWRGSWPTGRCGAGRGVTMLASVALFGLMTLVFAFSRSMPLSVICLAILGGADMVSVFIRQSLVQIATPDRMRGRVSAVATVFIGASNELGEFESGVAARLLGPVGAVAFGGIGAMVVTAAWARMFPTLRDADTLA